MRASPVRAMLLLLSLLIVGAATAMIQFPPAPTVEPALALHVVKGELPISPAQSLPQPAVEADRPREATLPAASSPKQAPQSPSEAPVPSEEPAGEAPDAAPRQPAVAESSDGAEVSGEPETAPPGADGADGQAAREPGPSQEAIASALSAYRQQVRSLIAASRRYPAIARRLGHTGGVEVFFVLDREGNLLTSEVKSGSGFPELDEAALAAVHAVGRFPPFPSAVKREKLDFQVSLVFELE